MSKFGCLNDLDHKMTSENAQANIIMGRSAVQNSGRMPAELFVLMGFILHSTHGHWLAFPLTVVHFFKESCQVIREWLIMENE